MSKQQINKSFIILVTLVIVLFFSMPLMASQENKDYSLDVFKEAFDFVLENYVDELTPQELEELAIKGMLTQLDLYSEYFNAEEYETFQTKMSGHFEGVGLYLEQIGGQVIVSSAIPDTPAERAGIMAGDTIIKVDDLDIDGLTLPEVVSLIKGQPGTEVSLTVLRDGADEPLVFNLVRDVIKIPVVRSEILEENIGYIRLTEFTSNSPFLFSKALNELINLGAKGIILDLRNNPGGYLNAALSIASPFVGDNNNLLHIESRADGEKTYYSTSKKKDIPLVVLVNRGSASASEIVAGAIQDHGAGIVVGTTTFGKASVQHIHKLSNGGALKVTTARYLTPSKRIINAIGIIPDIIVEDSAEQLSKAVEILTEEINIRNKRVN
jgi:carboxyl-terminal processing protease